MIYVSSFDPSQNKLHEESEKIRVENILNMNYKCNYCFLIYFKSKILSGYFFNFANII